MKLMEVMQKLTAGELAGWGLVLLILAMTLVEISPIRLNPWKHILRWVGKIINEDTEKKIDDLQQQERDMWVNNRRNQILIFSREARGGVEHSSDEWTNILNTIADYEAFCLRNKITNGIVKADSEYIRGLYQELSREHRI